MDKVPHKLILPRSCFIPGEAWKKNRDRLVAQTKRRLHVLSGHDHDFPSRFDYILTAREVTQIVEEIMWNTERLCQYYVAKEQHETRKPDVANS